jgi:hypothetical protein
VSTEKLDVRAVARDVRSVYARHWKLLIPAAIVILLPQAVIDGVFDGLNVEGIHSAKDVAILAAVPLTVAVSLLGQAIYAGFAASAVVEWRGVHAVPGLAGMLRSLPLGRLVVLDVILTLGTAVGFALLVIPGLVFIAYFGISPAIVKFERVGPWAAMKRSVHLVRGQFWRVFALVVGVTLVVEGAVSVISSLFHGLALVALVNLALEGLVEPIEGLTIVLVALGLLELRGEALAPEALELAPAA